LNQIIEYKNKVVTLLGSVVAIAVAVSQGGAEIAKLLGDWDGQLVNIVALIPAVILVVRRVTPVAKGERGLG
jgi:hypothetical protein